MRIGIAGAGQLGRMLALAGLPMGLQFLLLDARDDACGGQVAPLITGALDDPEALRRLGRECDLVTFEVENIPAAAAAAAAEFCPVQPPPEALAAAQDRLHEKRLFEAVGIPVAPFRTIDAAEDLPAALAELGAPAVLKTRRMGYDGRGQRFVRDADEAFEAWQALGGVPMVLEQCIAFDREVSLVGVARASGERRYYPLTHNVHRDGILATSVAPHADPALQQLAERHVGAVLDRLGYGGVLTLEFFVVDGRLLANEMAPRVHNSGHWTIEGAATSQFENHLRGILDLPLGDTSVRGHAGMVNFLGTLPDRSAVLTVPGAHYHAYGKHPRPGRKIGHATVVADNAAALADALARLEALAGVRAGN